jgi:hypothetical protein
MGDVKRDASARTQTVTTVTGMLRSPTSELKSPGSLVNN